MGKMLRGILKRLNKVKETKAVLASRTLLGSDRTNVAKEAWNHFHEMKMRKR